MPGKILESSAGTGRPSASELLQITHRFLTPAEIQQIISELSPGGSITPEIMAKLMRSNVANMASGAIGYPVL